LIERLAADLKPVDRQRVEKMVCGSMGLAMLGSLILVVAWLHVRSDLSQVEATTMFWSKLLYGLTIALFAGALTCRLARPGREVAGLWPLVALPFLAADVWGARDLSATSGPHQVSLWLGQTWAVCPLLIVALALPGLAGLLWALRRQAPTRLRLAGMAAGLTAGGIGATAYALHCSEDSTPFLATWYSLGILLTGGLGALLAPRWLRW
jgi:hypothetical protein